jgi:4-amino-4-deoxy-L-arabinose transferase-like glycosyltransferase
MVVSYVLFFIAGLGFGYAALGRWKWLPLVLPLLLALFTLLRDGGDGALVVRLIIALVVTSAGVIAGSLLDRDEPRARAEPGWR